MLTIAEGIIGNKTARAIGYVLKNAWEVLPVTPRHILVDCSLAEIKAVLLEVNNMSMEQYVEIMNLIQFLLHVYSLLVIDFVKEKSIQTKRHHITS